MRSRHAVNQEEPPQHAEHSAAPTEDSIQCAEEPLQHIEDPDTPLSSPRASNNQESKHQEVESDEEDCIPIKQLRPSRRRQLSPDSDSEGHESEANTAPTATTSTAASTSAASTSVPSTSASTNAPASTSIANNMPPSAKQINRRTANDFAGTTAVDRFYKHMEDDAHFKYFYDKSSHRCPFGYEKGFFNEFALHRHIQRSNCEETPDLLAAIKNCSMCSATSPDVLGALMHLEQSHDQVLADANIPLYL
ncbi:hypothetical protein KCU85_g1208, partial [Aureobasidium melanogenum]